MDKWIGRLFAAIVFSVIFGGVIYFVVLKPSGEDIASEQGEIETTVVEIADIVDKVKLRGKVVAHKTTPVFPEASGQVTKIHFEEGQLVKKGSVLLEINQSQLETDVEKQRMQLEKTEITLRNIKENFKRTEALFKEKFIPESEYGDAKKALDLAKLDYDMTKNELDSLTSELGNVTVKAPITGVVTRKNVEEGQTVTGASKGAGKVLLVITDVTEKSLEMLASEADLAVLKVGKPVKFWLDIDPDNIYEGGIKKIDAAASKSGGVSMFRVEVDIDDKKADFMLGVSANVEVVADEAAGVLSLPVEAIFKDGDMSYVYVPAGKSYEKMTVETGVSNIDLIEIQSGLAEGDRVLLDEPPEK